MPAIAVHYVNLPHKIPTKYIPLPTSDNSQFYGHELQDMQGMQDRNYCRPKNCSKVLNMKNQTPDNRPRVLWHQKKKDLGLIFFQGQFCWTNLSNQEHF